MDVDESSQGHPRLGATSDDEAEVWVMKADKCLLTDTQGSSNPQSYYTELVERHTEETLCRQPLLSYVDCDYLMERARWIYAGYKRKGFILNLRFTPSPTGQPCIQEYYIYWISGNNKAK